MKRVATVFLLLVCTGSLLAQRRGSTEVGGTFTFHSASDADQRNVSELGLDGLVGFYLSHDVGIDLEPGFRIGFFPDSVNVSSLILGSVRMRLFDMSPSGYRKGEIYRTDLGISSSVFANIGFGFWSDGFSLSQKPGTSYSGPAIMAGIGTHSRFGRFSSLRVKLQWIELFPNGPIYTKRRSLVQIGMGFGIFIRS